MGRKRKVESGNARTFVLRTDQMERIKETAVWMGVDPSDVLRAGLDLVLNGYNCPVRARAILELLWIEILTAPPGVKTSVRAGCRGEKITVPIDAANRVHVNLINRTINALKGLGITPPENNAEEFFLPTSWASTADRTILTLLASLVVKVLSLDATGRPALVLVAPIIIETGKQVEYQYIPAAKALELLYRMDVVHPDESHYTRLPADHTPLPYPGVVYKIHWNKLATRSNMFQPVNRAAPSPVTEGDSVDE